MENKKPKIYFMSNPKTTAADRRSYLVRIPDDTPALIRVYVKADNRKFICDCVGFRPSVFCEHIRLAAAADDNKFYSRGK